MSAAEVPDLEGQISRIAMRINSTYSTLTHQPLVLLRQDTSYSQFLALMSVADIFMVTCLREGMNLTSHDYIQCQDGKLTSQRHGSLILSEFAGSASIFGGHGLLVNPWDYKQCADAINAALTISPEQKQHNWQYLRSRMAPHTAIAWVNSFSKALSESRGALLFREPDQLSSLSINTLKRSYDDSSLRLFLLEDEGIIASTKTSNNPSSSPFQQTLSLLNKLLQDPRNIVYLTSSKSPEQLEPLRRAVPRGTGLIAENGCFLLDPHTKSDSDWEPLLDVDRTKDWRNGVRKVMQYFLERTDASWAEERRCSLTFHYDRKPENKEKGENDDGEEEDFDLDFDPSGRQASELADQINGARGSEAIRVVLTDGAVIFEPSDVTKATAADRVLRRLLPRVPGFLFVAGGARSDEALFRWANGLEGESQGTLQVPNVFTLFAGTHATQAKTVLTGDISFEMVIDALCSV